MRPSGTATSGRLSSLTSSSSSSPAAVDGVPSWHGRGVPGISDHLSVSDRVSVAVAGAGYTAIGDHLRQVLPEAEIELVASHSLRERERFATVLIPVMSRIDATVMDRIEGLRLIQQWGAGLEGVDIDAATTRGITVANVATAGTGNAESVAGRCVMAATAVVAGSPSSSR